MVGLRETRTDAPGWRRRRAGRGWTYLTETGEPLPNAHKRRCRDLVIPPAWAAVWINPAPKGHILAYGEDEAGRRQYIYHPAWRAARERAKYQDLPAFADKLPRLRRRIARLLRDPPDDRALAKAVLVRLFDRGALRIGSRRTVPDAFGATTLRKRHVELDRNSGAMTLDYRAKGGARRQLVLQDARLVHALAHLEALPGVALFDLPSGPLRSEDVNGFIADLMGQGFSAKDFRTWTGSSQAAGHLRGSDQLSITAMSRAVADRLGNTPAIARSSDIRPALIELARRRARPERLAGPRRLRREERACYGAIQDYEAAANTD